MRADKIKDFLPEKKEDMTPCIGGGETRTMKARGYNSALSTIGQKELELCFNEVRKDIEKELCIHDYSEYVSFKESLWEAISSRISEVLVVKGDKC